MVHGQEDQQTGMTEQMDTTFREVLSKMSQADSMRHLWWFLSAASRSCAGPTCSVSGELTSITTLELEGTAAPRWAAWHLGSALCLQFPLHQTPWQPAFQLGNHSFALAPGLKCKKQDCSPGSIPEGQSSKRAHAGTEEGSISCGHGTLPIQPVASHSPKQQEPELVNLPSNPVKVATDPDDRLAVEASGNTIDHDRDSVVEVHRDDANQSGDKSDSSGDLLESVAYSGPKSATRDCLICPDTEEAAVNSTQKKVPDESWGLFMHH